jgi:hypothetical protein
LPIEAVTPKPSGPAGQEFVVREGAPIRFGGITFDFAADRNLVRFNGRGYTVDLHRATRIEIEDKFVLSATFVHPEDGPKAQKKGAKLTVTWVNPTMGRLRVMTKKA